MDDLLTPHQQELIGAMKACIDEQRPYKRYTFNANPDGGFGLLHDGGTTLVYVGPGVGQGDHWALHAVGCVAIDVPNVQSALRLTRIDGQGVRQNGPGPP